jgi:hypothetical protein
MKNIHREYPQRPLTGSVVRVYHRERSGTYPVKKRRQI